MQHFNLTLNIHLKERSGLRRSQEPHKLCAPESYFLPKQKKKIDRLAKSNIGRRSNQKNQRPSHFPFYFLKLIQNVYKIIMIVN